MKRDFTRVLDLSAEECFYLLERAAFMKSMRRARGEYRPLRGKTLAMIFEKASTRTRVSFELGIKELGGAALYLSASETQIGRGEPIRDTARVLSRYVDAIMIRTYAQETVNELARWASVPVINGLSDAHHPCQILADLFTIQELKGDLERLKIAYIGDVNNMAQSWIEAAALLGLNLAVASPEGYGPAAEFSVLRRALTTREEGCNRDALFACPQERGDQRGDL
ncbi:MAG: argF [Deltaproteobacteria bacterium]|nr:argF [Deltaproteobacteria bacterium]